MKSLPKIEYKSNKELDIEVMTFAKTQEKLEKTSNHNPFSPHKIQFYLILIITENMYSHYVDSDFII
ncbi:hypothetical protein [uncultured Algibacter sp.]|uniref:hypothetical protein n=1 Tax=uncultured Algibacter sp. TaxID=298659 RepID=UPI002601F561|nr:hypothetical protein [uncultured Algibacter sp.]